MKECELCKKPARIHCDSDQASLCLACDAKVHSANFLVARHSRNLLCQYCQAPTPWRAAGGRLVPAISVCLKCVGRCRGAQAQDPEVESRERMIAGEGDEEGMDDGDEEDVEAEDEEEQEEDEKDGENQVVPWTSSLCGPAASPSSGEESFRRGGHYGFAGIGAENPAAVLMKRRRDDGDFLHQNRTDARRLRRTAAWRMMRQRPPPHRGRRKSTRNTRRQRGRGENKEAADRHAEWSPRRTPSSSVKALSIVDLTSNFS